MATNYLGRITQYGLAAVLLAGSSQVMAYKSGSVYCDQLDRQRFHISCEMTNPPRRYSYDLYENFPKGNIEGRQCKIQTEPSRDYRKDESEHGGMPHYENGKDDHGRFDEMPSYDRIPSIHDKIIERGK